MSAKTLCADVLKDALSFSPLLADRGSGTEKKPGKGGGFGRSLFLKKRQRGQIRGRREINGEVGVLVPFIGEDEKGKRKKMALFHLKWGDGGREITGEKRDRENSPC